MTQKRAPAIATWILDQFGSDTENEAAIGDLVEQYQRGQGSIWYLRQVLSIVSSALLREVRRNKWMFATGVVRTWLVWVGLQYAGAVGFLMLMYLSDLMPTNPKMIAMAIPRTPLDPRLSLFSMDHPLLSLAALLLGPLTLLATGICCTRSSKSNPRSVLVAFVFSYLFALVGILTLRLVYLSAYVLAVDVIRSISSIILAAALIFVGGLRGLSSKRPRNFSVL